MKVKKILDIKRTNVFAVRPETPMREFGQLVVEQRIGAAPVTDSDGALLGVISERDIVRGFHAHGAALGEMTVGDAMTRPVICCGSENTISDVVELMSEHKIRHIAVVDGGVLMGFISIRDVAFNRVSQLEHDNELLHIMLESHDTVL